MADQTEANSVSHAGVSPEDVIIEAADEGSESGYGSVNSDTTSISSSIYAGYIENGRRYQSTREGGEYWGPSDEKQFESLQASHIVHLVLDSKTKNNLFHAPIPETVQNILDIGTGTGAWAIDVADRYPGAVVHGIDLYPPPDTWVPPNCTLEVDDVLKTWTFQKTFDFIHLRDLYGSFTDKQWTGLYQQAYNNLVPGGWIEEVESGICWLSDDGTVAPDSLLAKWGPMFTKLCAKTGRDIDVIETFKSRIEAAGFTNVQEKLYKVPAGEWTKNKVLREAGKFTKSQFIAGMEGYSMAILTKARTPFGEPTPWQPEEVQVYLAKVRKELETPGVHIYHFRKRVWAQKPLDA